jgi:primosomal protein N' (replication factor Y) (superfamily II helicase)
VLGPAPLFRLKDLYRSRLVVKAADRPAAVATVGAAVREVAADRKLKNVKLAVDVDPQ